MSAAQDFGKALEIYRGSTSRYDLASWLLSNGGFQPPSVRDANDLARHLADIEAGHPWPFAKTDLSDLTLAVIACLPKHLVVEESALRIAGADYFCNL